MNMRKLLRSGGQKMSGKKSFFYQKFVLFFDSFRLIYVTITKGDHMDYKVRYRNYKGIRCQVTIRNASSKDLAVRFVKKFFGKPLQIKPVRK